MNQNARKTAKASVEKDFYKLLNNSNFGNDCRNNIGSCKLDLLYDGLDEIKYIKKHTNILNDQQLSKFFSVDLLKEQATNEFNEKCEKVDKAYLFYLYVTECLLQKLEEDLEAIEMYSKKKEKENFYKTNI